MGQAFDRDGNVLGEAYGETKREVFDKLTAQFKDAHELRIKSLKDKLDEVEQSQDAASMEMPRYKCHKEVWALKIFTITDPTVPGNESDGSRLLYFADAAYAPIRVEREYVRKHNPQAGGYYVVYKDGYRSFSPAEAFEEGYTRLQA